MKAAQEPGMDTHAARQDGRIGLQDLLEALAELQVTGDRCWTDWLDLIALDRGDRQ